MEVSVEEFLSHHHDHLTMNITNQHLFYANVKLKYLLNSTKKCLLDQSVND